MTGWEVLGEAIGWTAAGFLAVAVWEDIVRRSRWM